jgi:hypothetical protein
MLFFQEKSVTQIYMQIKINFKNRTVPQNNPILSRPKKVYAVAVERMPTGP